jgi:hypothetical protein
MDRMNILRAAYEILENVTPLRLDCGKLCEQACCSNMGDEETGMYLFPGEKDLLVECEGWLSITSLDHIRPGLYLAKCNETCPRTLRPLACRIFPLTPYLTSNEVLQIKIDPRAGQVCPLARDMKRKDLRPEFVKAVRKACTLLISEPSIKEYIQDLSRMLDAYIDLSWYRLERQ